MFKYLFVSFSGTVKPPRRTSGIIVYQARFGFINNQSTDQIPRELTDTLLRPLELREMRLS